MLMFVRVVYMLFVYYCLSAQQMPRSTIRPLVGAPLHSHSYTLSTHIHTHTTSIFPLTYSLTLFFFLFFAFYLFFRVLFCWGFFPFVLGFWLGFCAQLENTDKNIVHRLANEIKVQNKKTMKIDTNDFDYKFFF